MNDLQKDKVVLLFGGRSTEHDASVGMHEYFRKELQHDRQVEIEAEIYISPEGDCFIYKWDAPPRIGELTAANPVTILDMVAIVKMMGCFCFSLLQGRDGEDGNIQGLAAFLDIPGNFGAVYPSCLGTHKWAQAVIAGELLQEKLKKIETALVWANSSPAQVASVVDRFAGRECVIKPNSLGASFFAEPVSTLSAETLLGALERIQPFDPCVLVQERIVGREVSCGFLVVHPDIELLPVIEVKPTSGFMGRREKSGVYERSVLPRFDPIFDLVMKATLTLARHGGYHTAGRADFMVDQNGDAYLLEVNSMPGLMQTSLYTEMLREAGYSIADLVRTSIANEVHYREARRAENEAVSKFVRTDK